MHSLEEENKIAFMTCIEIVLMRRGNTHYNLVMAKLKSYYDCGVLECLEHPENLRTVLKEVYHKDYNSVLDDISAESERLVDMDKFKAQFFKVMES